MNLRALSLCSALLLGACGSETETVQTVDVADADSVCFGIDCLSTGAEAPDNEAASDSGPTGSSGIQQSLLTIPSDIFSALPEKNATRTALFGDLHVHTTYSFDAFAFGTLATPYDAYRYALGDTIKHPAGYDMTLRVPLDFYAVTDHAMYMGVSRQAADPSTEIARIMNLDYMENLNAPENLIPGGTPQRTRAFLGFLSDAGGLIADGTLSQDLVHDITRDAWKDTVAAAEQYNKPGEFTTFVAYEYTTSTADRGNLHRNVIFRDADKLPAVPFSRVHSRNPEDLWDWMDNLRELGVESLAIPHNSNGSNGQMFKLVDWAGNPMSDEYATKRMRTPVVMLNASRRSSTISGNGTTIIRSIDITPAARTISDLRTRLFKGILVVATGHPLPRGL